MDSIVLYSTLGCHLCEDAEMLLHQLKREEIVDTWQVIDIADSDTLVDQYGIRIPVILYREQELGWPFTIDDLKTFIAT